MNEIERFEKEFGSDCGWLYEIGWRSFYREYLFYYIEAKMIKK
jgi:hypothetical protein